MLYLTRRTKTIGAPFRTAGLGAAASTRRYAAVPAAPSAAVVKPDDEGQVLATEREVNDAMRCVSHRPESGTPNGIPYSSATSAVSGTKRIEVRLLPRDNTCGGNAMVAPLGAAHATDVAIVA